MNKTLLKYFLLLAIIILVVFNWGYITWFFNYSTIGENIGYVVKQAFGQTDLTVFLSSPAPAWSDFSGNTGSANDNSQPIQSNQVSAQQKPKAVLTGNETAQLSVPAIGVQAPIMFTVSRSQNVYNNLLKAGVLHFPDSVLPGEIGTAIILGHSAPPNWPRINYDRVFNNLNLLKQGDEILISFQGQDYRYLVSRTFFVKKAENLSPHLTFDKNMLLLVSCWPPGHNLQRIVVEAEMVTN